jgi:hypothetical protein
MNKPKKFINLNYHFKIWNIWNNGYNYLVHISMNAPRDITRHVINKKSMWSHEFLNVKWTFNAKKIQLSLDFKILIGKFSMHLTLKLLIGWWSILNIYFNTIVSYSLSAYVNIFIHDKYNVIISQLHFLFKIHPYFPIWSSLKSIVIWIIKKLTMLIYILSSYVV